MNPITLFAAAVQLWLAIPPTLTWTCHPPSDPETKFTITAKGDTASVTLASDGRQGAGYTVERSAGYVTLTREYKLQKILVTIDRRSGATIVQNPTQTSYFQCDQQ